jgi:glycerol kinase
MSNFLAIDQGTTSSRAIIFSSNHELITDSKEEYSLSYPNDGWVEAEPNDILKTVKQTLEKVLKENSETITC